MYVPKVFPQKRHDAINSSPFYSFCQIGQINTSVEFDENCLECVKIKQEKENENT